MCITTPIHSSKDMHKIVNSGSPERVEYEKSVCVYAFIFSVLCISILSDFIFTQSTC